MNLINFTHMQIHVSECLMKVLTPQLLTQLLNTAHWHKYCGSVTEQTVQVQSNFIYASLQCLIDFHETLRDMYLHAGKVDQVHSVFAFLQPNK